jgi:DegV family protein with EDD domain
MKQPPLSSSIGFPEARERMSGAQPECRAVSIQVVTDSFAHRSQGRSSYEDRLHVLPNRLRIGGRTYREGVDLSDKQVFDLLAGTDPADIAIQPPTPAEYVSALRRLANPSGILIITPSRELSSSWQHAHEAAEQLSGLCPIAVVDSKTLSCAQGVIVERALEQAASASDLDDLVRSVRRTVERVYLALYLDSPAALEHIPTLSPSHALMGSLLGIRPLLTVENGQLNAIEKVRTRIHGMERLVEFFIEFEHIEQALVFDTHGPNSAAIQEFQERLALEGPQHSAAIAACGPSLAALVGASLLGLVILEQDEIEVEDGS